MYNIISSGSKGNAVIIADKILIDCGVPFKSLKPFVDDLALVLLTHIHSDHFCKRTITKLADERPGLMWACGPWLANELHDCGVPYAQITSHMYGNRYSYRDDIPCTWFEPFMLYHNVKNCGYKLAVYGKKIIYATDTSKLITNANGYDLFLIEGNYTEDDLQRRIDEKELAGEQYIYDKKVPEHHLSVEAAMDFINANAKPDSQYVLLHEHEDREPLRDTLNDAGEGEYTPEPGNVPQNPVATAVGGE